MRVRNPIESAKIAYTTSRAGTRNIMDAIKGNMEFSLPDHNVLMSDAMANMHTTLQQQDEVTLHSTLANSELNARTRRAIQRAVHGRQDIIMVNCSAYVTHVHHVGNLSYPLQGGYTPLHLAAKGGHTTY